jgi:hypothetical protein
MQRAWGDEKRDGKRPLMGPRRWKENTIKTDIKDTVWMCELDSNGSGSVAGSCEHGNELPVSIKGGIFID